MLPTRIIHLPTIVRVLPDTARHHPGYHPQTQPTAPWQVYKDINLLAVVVAGISLTLHALAGSGGGALLGGAGEQGASPPLGGTAAELGGELHKALRGIVERWVWAVVRMAETVEGCCGEQRLQVSCQTPDRDGHGYTRAEQGSYSRALASTAKGHKFTANSITPWFFLLQVAGPQGQHLPAGGRNADGAGAGADGCHGAGAMSAACTAWEERLAAGCIERLPQAGHACESANHEGGMRGLWCPKCSASLFSAHTGLSPLAGHCVC